MRELLFVGRGGEGLVLASQVLADAFARAGFFVQCFPEFKAERRGAPVSAFLRWDDRPIHRRYKVRACDALAVLSPAPPPPQALAAVRDGGLVLLNRDTRFPLAGPFHVARVPASRIARQHGIVSPEGRPLGNVAVLGALVRLLLPDALPELEAAVLARTGARADANLAAARDGYVRCTRQHALPEDLVAPAWSPPPPRDDLRFPVSTTDSLGNLTGSWATERPVLSEACSACGVCALFCPEGVISREHGSIAIDERYCKGCGICVSVCPVQGALHLEEVHA